MKQHFSIPMLLSRAVMPSLLLSLVLIVGLDAALMAGLVALAPTLTEQMGRTVELYECTDLFFFSVIFLAALLLPLRPLLRVGAHSDSQLGFTIRRLSISERAFTLWHWGFGALCFLLVWAAQIVVIYNLGLWYNTRVPTEVVNHQTMMLTFYRSEFLTNLLPLSDLTLWGRNLLAVLTLGGVCANYGLGGRRGIDRTASVWVAAILTIGCFLSSGRYLRLLHMVAPLGLAALLLYLILCFARMDKLEKEVSPDEDQTQT